MCCCCASKRIFVVEILAPLPVLSLSVLLNQILRFQTAQDVATIKVKVERSPPSANAVAVAAAAAAVAAAATVDATSPLDDSLADFHVHATPVKVESAATRQIAVEFLDVSNEQKYDRLVADDKIKNPFKRRLSGNSNGSRSTSPLSMQAMQDDADEADSKPPGGVQLNAIKVEKSEVDMNSVSPVSAASVAAQPPPHKNLPKRSRYEHNSQLSLASSGTSSSTASAGGPRSRSDQNQRKRGPPAELERNEETLARRQKQIDYGKNTVGYDLYVQQVPREERTNEHPWTPPKNAKYSRRGWDGLVKVWRKKLHCWDPESMKAEPVDGGEESADSDSSDEDEKKPLA